MKDASISLALPGAVADRWHGPFAALFEDLLAPVGPGNGKLAVSGHWSPPADVRETDAAYRVELELPAVDPAEVHIEVRDDVLRVSGERAPSGNEDERVRHRERRYGKFARSFRLPKDADPAAVTATGKHGVVSITVGKLAQAQPRTVAVEAA